MPTASSQPEINVTLHSQPDPTQVEWNADVPDASNVKWETKVSAVPEEANAIAQPKSEFLGKPPGYVPETSGGGLKGALQRAWEFENTPLIDIGGAVEKATPEATTTAGQVAAGTARAAGNIAGGLTTPLSLETLAALPAAHAVPVVAKALLALFGSQQALSAAKEQIPAVAEAIGEGDTQKAIQRGVEAGAGTAMAAGAVAGGRAVSLKPIKPTETLVDVTPDGNAVVEKPTGEIVKELPPANPVLGEVSNAVLATRAGVKEGDLDGFAKWFSDEYLNGKPVTVTTGKQIVSQTVDSPDAIKVDLSDRDSTLLGLYHELSQHAVLEDGHTLTGGSVPHDNNAIAADVVAQASIPSGQPRKIAILSGRGINRPDNTANSILDQVRGIVAADPATGTKIYKDVSRRLASKEKTSQKLEQLMALNEEAARAARAKPSARNAAMVEMGEPLLKIADILGGVEEADKFTTAIRASRLVGIKDFWQKTAVDVKAMGDEDLQNRIKTYQDLVNDKLDSLKIGGKPASDMITPGMWHAKDSQPLRQALSEIFKAAAANVGDVAIGEHSSLAAYEKATPNLPAAKQVYRDEIEPRLNAIQKERAGPFTENLGPWKMFIPLDAIDENGELIHPKTGFRGGLAEPGNPHGNMATGQFTYSGKARDVVDAYARMKTSAAKANLLQILRTSGVGVTGDQPPAFIKPPGSPRALSVDRVPVPMLDGSNLWLPQTVTKWVRPILDATYLDTAQPEAGAMGRALNSIQMGGPIDLLIHNATMFWKIASLPASTGSGLWQAGRAPMIGRFIKMFEPFFNDDVVNPSSDRGQKVFDFMVKGGQLPARYATVTTNPKFAELTGAELKRPTLAKPVSLEALTFGPHGTDYRARAIATAAYMNENPLGKPSDPEYVHFMERFGVYRKELLGDYLQRAKSSGAAPFATAFLSGLKAGKSAVTLGGAMPTTEGQLSLKGIGMRAENMFQSGATGALLGWFGIHKLLTGQWLPSKGTPLMMVPADQMDKDIVDKLPKGVLWGDKSGRKFLDITTLYPIEGRGFRAYGVRGAFDTLNSNGTVGQALEAATRDTLNSRLQFAGPAMRFATRMGGRDLYLSPLRDSRGKPQFSLIQSAPTAEPGLPQLWENTKGAVAGANPLIERPAREYENGYGGTFGDRVIRMIMGFAGIRPGYLQRGTYSPAIRNLIQRMYLPQTIMREKLFQER